jgi:hypothetical protein
VEQAHADEAIEERSEEERDRREPSGQRDGDAA